MIKFSEPRAGWMDLYIGDYSFPVSYLSDLWSELDYLLNLKDCSYSNIISLDGESAGTLTLVVYLSDCDEKLNVVWHLNENKPVIMDFPFGEFVKEYEKEKERITLENYVKNFVMEERYEKIDDADNYLYDYGIINKKYPNTCLTVVEDIDYDYEENPYVSGYYMEVINYDTNEKRYVEGD